jgi:uncharacterized protein
MLDPIQLLSKHATSPEALQIVQGHSQAVANKALQIAVNFPEADKQFLLEASLLHDIGVFSVKAPKIHCFGQEPYIKHGLIGAEILRQAGLPRHARVAETHTGVGITKTEILTRNLPLPAQDYLAESLEEKIISYADLFFSKSNKDKLAEEETPQQIAQELAQFGQDKAEIFWQWHKEFGE